MIKLKMALSVLSFTLAVTACQDLEVTNPNAPDQERALAEPGDVEALIGSSYRTHWNAIQWDCYPSWALSTAADETTSSWGNCTMQDFSSEPRAAFNNTTGYTYSGLNRLPWYRLYSSISSANDGLRAIAGGLKIGKDGEGNPRARAFAKFVQGMSHAYLALLFDRAFVFDETMDLTTTKFELRPYNEVMTEAIRMLDEAITIANANTFTLSDKWINGNPLTNKELAQVANSYIARFMTAVARTPAERNAVNWSEVLNRISKGITKDFFVVLDGNDNWGDFTKQRPSNSTWFRADYMTVGPTDTSGNFQRWLATPVAQRMPFDVHTADRRITGATPQSAGTDFRYVAGQAFRQDRGTYHWSRYVHTRHAWVAQTHTGPDVVLSLTEMDLLRAEALLQRGDRAGAVALINKTRVGRGKLPPLTADMSVAEIKKWLMYEKRIELFAMASGLAFFDARGWGILVPGTALHLPLPAQELEVLGMPLYTFGGSAGGAAAP